MYRQVLKILNNKQVYTAEKLAAQLAINTNKLKLIIDDLIAYGINIEYTNGYKLAEPIDLLDLNTIKTSIKHKSVDLKVFDVIDSTNEYALSINDIKKPLICLAEYQTAGRGRQEHNWISSYASGLCLSIRYSYADAAKLSGLSIALAVTIARILYSIGITEIGLKWPNDVFWQHRKLAGLLLESRYGKKYEIVVGIGINVKMSITNKISQPWVDLATILPENPKRNILAASLIDSCLITLLNYPNTGLEPFLPDWQRFDLSYGKLVTLYKNNNYIQGFANGINEQGALQINQQSYIDGSLQLV